MGIFQQSMQVAFRFLFGQVNSTLSAFFLFSAIALIISYLSNKMKAVKEQSKYIGVYNVLIIISHHIDIIIINNIAPAEDTTRMFVIILMSARVLNEIFAYFKTDGITIPKILTLSVEKMEELDKEDLKKNLSGKEKDDMNQWNEEKISKQIEYISKKIKNFEELEKQIKEKLDRQEGGENE